jgi:TMEM175 potassium channel family protein
MDKGRLEAFTDGVIAIIITIMVLDLRLPNGASFAALRAEFPILGVYALSYVNVGVFWNNHHHMLQASERVNGLVLWMNMLLLFWISLVPLEIRWMDQTHFASVPTASYGVILIMSAISYVLLEWALVRCNGPDSKLARAVGNEAKGWMSLTVYILAVGLAFTRPWISIALYVLVATIWFIPDRRIESLI